jgi:hypothetical protein
MIAGVTEDGSVEKPAAMLEAGDLRAVFVRRGDRYAHRIEARDAATQAWTVVLESHEGTDEEHWPPSPPFQQLHVEHRKEGDVVLLVGMAGRSHWSAAVDVSPDGKSLRFDVAVRVQVSAERLRSDYEVKDAVAAERLAASRGEGTGQGGGRVTDLSSGEIRSFLSFGPGGETPAGHPATRCWKYSLGLKPTE